MFSAAIWRSLSKASQSLRALVMSEVSRALLLASIYLSCICSSRAFQAGSQNLVTYGYLVFRAAGMPSCLWRQ